MADDRESRSLDSYLSGGRTRHRFELPMFFTVPPIPALRMAFTALPMEDLRFATKSIQERQIVHFLKIWLKWPSERDVLVYYILAVAVS